MAYDGTLYSGFQIQPDADTIQKRIEDALTVVYKTGIRINYAGRTDAGVHALAQYIDFNAPFEIPLEGLKSALNAILPMDIRICDVFHAEDGFHSRYSAIYRDYTYLIYNTPTQSPFLRLYTWHIKEKLNLKRMRETANLFKGKKDYSFIANEPEEKNCIREVHFIHIGRRGKFVILHIRANGFLRGMVRNIVGVLVASATNRLKMSITGNIIGEQAGVKSLKAPPMGLFLSGVTYPKGVLHK